MTASDDHFQLSRRHLIGGAAGVATASVLSVTTEPAQAINKRPPQTVRARDRELLNSGWRHVLGDPQDAQKPGTDDSSWQSLSIPHTWNAADALDDEPGFYRGPGWYRRSLQVSKSMLRKRVFLHFEGAFQVADVYVDGDRVGGHIGGYTAFTVEITQQLARRKPGSDVVIAVRVDNSHVDDIPPYSGDWTYYGGMYRNVWLVTTSNVHFDVLDHGSAGIWIDTPQAAAHRAVTRVRGRAVNDTQRPTQATVRSTVIDKEDRVVTQRTTTIRISAGESHDFSMTLPAIPRPKLWSPESPYLYRVVTTLESRSGTDRIDSPLGIRWFSVDPNSGFSLNGEQYLLRGTNRHQDRVGQGNALQDADHVRDMKLIKEMGANVVRLAHYPQSPAVLEAADELGLIVWEEAPMVNRATMTQAFIDNHLSNIRDMARQHYNHPSIVVFGTMNEVLLRRPDPEPGGYVEWIRDMLQQGEDALRAEDSTRLTGMVGHQSDAYNTSGIADIPMVWGWNLYHGWYGGRVEQFGEWLDNHRAKFPQRVVWVTEFGADSDARLHRLQPGNLSKIAGRGNYHDQSIEFQQFFLETYLRAIQERPWLAGATYWSQFDFGSESRTGSVPHVNTKGLMLANRTPKPVYHLMQAWRDIDVLHIATDLWNQRSGIGPAGAIGYQSVEQLVTVYSNAAKVELRHNGKSLGWKNTDTIGYVSYLVPFTNGRNTLTAYAITNAGKQLRDDASVQFTYYPPILSDPNVPFTRLTVNVGGIVQFTDADRQVWIEDREYSDGSWGAITDDFTAGFGWMKNNWVRNSDEDPLYQTYRAGMNAYRFDVPDGRYRVTMRFAEITSAGDTGGDGTAVPAPDGKVQVPVGWRVFDVALNGQTVERDLDLVAKVGQHTPYDAVHEISAAKGEGVEITFIPKKNLPVISAIDLLRLA